MSKRQTVSIVAGIFALAVVALVLAYLAFSKTRAEIPAAGETPGYEKAIEVEQSGDKATGPDSAQRPGPLTDEKSPTETEPVISPATRTLAAADSLVAYRAFTGVCSSPTDIEVSLDGGYTWNVVDTAAAVRLGSLQRLIPNSDGFVAAIGQVAEDCTTVAAIESFTYGDAWRDSPTATEQSWFTDPTNPNELHGVGGAIVTAPCPVARLSAESADRVAVICADGSLATSANAGSTWNHSDPIPGIDAVEAGRDTTRIAVVGDPTCEGTLVRTLTATLESLNQTCIPAVGTPGATALSESSDGSLWLWAGETVLHSSDAGATWQ